VLKGTWRGKRRLKGARRGNQGLKGVLEKGGRAKKRNTLDGQGLEGALERR
jgi:hypothetical protein